MNALTEGHPEKNMVILETVSFEAACRTLALRNEQQYRRRKIDDARARKAKQKP